jgi:plastocyanin
MKSLFRKRTESISWWNRHGRNGFPVGNRALLTATRRTQVRKFETILMLATTLLLTLSVMSCGDDEAPEPDIRIESSRFFPAHKEIQAGESVRWVNVNRKGDTRTVTSGLVDSTATHGLLFDESLEGYESGEAFGQSYSYKFEERGVWHYFTRLPADNQYTGTIVVR